MKKVLSIGVIFVVVLSALLMPTIHTVNSEIDNEHKRIITVDNSANPDGLTDYQVFINVTYDSDMQPDFDDLRFTWYDESSDAEVNIDYWLDKYVDSEYALVWVEVPSIKALGQETLYMYYGDPDAVSGSNGEETFIFFDGFSTDTTANYQLWSPLFPPPSSGNPNEFSWDPNGWLFVNASIRECYGKNSNVNVYHKTAVMDPSEEKYWLETRCEAFGDGYLDYLGFSETYKRDSIPQENYLLAASVYQGIRDQYPMNFSLIYGLWGSPEWFNTTDLPTSVKDRWFRIGLGTAPNGTVIGSFCDDNYGELNTLVGQTTHQDAEWWINLRISRILTNTWATMHAYFDYVRVRKFTDPEPFCSIGEEEPLQAGVDIDPDTLNLRSNGQWVTAYITLPEGYNVEDIVLETVEAEGIPAEWSDIQNGVYMAKFDRASVQASVSGEPDYDSATKFYEIPLTVTGELVDGTAFEGRDTITVLKK